MKSMRGLRNCVQAAYTLHWKGKALLACGCRLLFDRQVEVYTRSHTCQGRPFSQQPLWVGQRLLAGTGRSTDHLTSGWGLSASPSSPSPWSPMEGRGNRRSPCSAQWVAKPRREAVFSASRALWHHKLGKLG
jgi:hypothetical protein